MKREIKTLLAVILVIIELFPLSIFQMSALSVKNKILLLLLSASRYCTVSPPLAIIRMITRSSEKLYLMVEDFETKRDRTS